MASLEEIGQKLILNKPMPTPKISTTDKERKILLASRNTNFGDAAEEAVWGWSVIDNANIPPNQARGVIASLVKKGLVALGNYENGKKPDDSTFELTALGVKICDQLVAIAAAEKSTHPTYSSPSRTEYPTEF